MKHYHLELLSTGCMALYRAPHPGFGKPIAIFEADYHKEAQEVLEMLVDKEQHESFDLALGFSAHTDSSSEGVGGTGCKSLTTD